MALVARKEYDEGTTSPYRARLWSGIMELRDATILDPALKRQFDDGYEPVVKALDKARETAREIHALVASHWKALDEPGAVVVSPNGMIVVNVPINPTLDRRFDSFTVFAHRAMKLTQHVVKTIAGIDIGFLFQTSKNFTNGLVAMRTSDPDLADYLDAVRRQFTDTLARLRNDIEHKGWIMPGIQYRTNNGQFEVGEFTIEDKSLTAYVNQVANDTIRFVEEVIVYALAKLLEPPRVVIELPEVQRASVYPKRFGIAVQGDYRTSHLRWGADSTDFRCDPP